MREIKSAAREVGIEIRDRMIMEHLPLVRAIAVRMRGTLPAHLDLDDLVHAGVLGLFDAAMKYNPDKKVPFSWYAKLRIRGAMLDSLRRLDWASRDLRRLYKQIDAAKRDLSTSLQRSPTEEEIAEELGADVRRLRQMMIDVHNVSPISASNYGPEHDDLLAPEFPSAPQTQPDNIYLRKQMRSMLDVAIKALPDRSKKVVLLHYTNEMTTKEIGCILGINQSRVSQIHKSALGKLQVVLQLKGIHSSHAF